jgi:hypothetical protein
MRTAGVVLPLAACVVIACVAVADEIHIPTDTGIRTLAGKEAEAYKAHNAWLEERLKEAESVRVGSTYADVAKLFKRDGGVSVPTTHRFVLVLCPFVKIDAEFEEKDGEKAKYPLAPTARVVKVSKPYLEREYGD